MRETQSIGQICIQLEISRAFEVAAFHTCLLTYHFLFFRFNLSPDCDPDLQCGAGWETGCLSRGGGHLHLHGE